MIDLVQIAILAIVVPAFAVHLKVRERKMTRDFAEFRRQL